MPKNTLRSLWKSWQFADSVLSLWDRMPKPLRVAIKWGLTPVTALIVSAATAGIIWATGFVQSHWPLIILSLLSGVGAGALIRIPIMALLDRLERFSESRLPSKHAQYSYHERETREKLREMLPHLEDGAIELLRDVQKSGSAPIKTEHNRRVKYNAPLIKYRALESIGEIRYGVEVFRVNPIVDDIVAGFLADL